MASFGSSEEEMSMYDAVFTELHHMKSGIVRLQEQVDRRKRETQLLLESQRREFDAVHKHIVERLDRLEALVDDIDKVMRGAVQSSSGAVAAALPRAAAPETWQDNVTTMSEGIAALSAGLHDLKSMVQEHASRAASRAASRGHETLTGA